MLPIRDRNPAATTPYVTYSIVMINIAVFGLEVYLDFTGGLDAFLYEWAMIPQQIMAGSSILTLVTSMFLHGGITHVLGNMLYLFIFGNNIEDALGHFKFIMFYLACGFAASFLHVLLTTDRSIPTLGASGAIAGVLGAYLVLYPRAKVDTLVIFVVFITWVTLPASVLLVFWFILQLFSGTLSIAAGTATGVAYFAHVGGFVAGALLALPFRRRVRRMPPERPRYFDEHSRDAYWF